MINNKVVLNYIKNETPSEMSSWVRVVVHQDHSVFLPFSYPDCLLELTVTIFQFCIQAGKGVL